MLFVSDTHITSTSTCLLNYYMTLFEDQFDFQTKEDRAIIKIHPNIQHVFSGREPNDVVDFWFDNSDNTKIQFIKCEQDVLMARASDIIRDHLEFE